MNACGQVLYDRKMHFTNRISDACIYVNTRTLVFHDVYSISLCDNQGIYDTWFDYYNTEE